MLSSQRAARIGLCLVCALAAVAAAYGAGLKTNYHYDAKGNLILVCSPGTDSCDGDEGNGCEVSLLTDAGHCSSCTHACSQNHASTSCVNGACVVSSCSAGYANCDGNPENGCEISLLTDAGHCSSCTHACSQNHASTSCVNGACVVSSCSTGYANCDGNPENGCEVNISTDVNRCGSCTHACSQNHASESCTNGACVVSSCSTGYANCDGNPENGCEVSLLTDVNRCGSCTHACSQNHASESCANGRCVVSSCSTGYANCDGNPENGCEVSLLTDRRNCGSCGHACSLPHATATCSNGICQIARCLSACRKVGGREGDVICNSYHNCNGNPADGCETALGTNSNCAYCGNACGPGQVCGSVCTGKESSHCRAACVASGGGSNK